MSESLHFHYATLRENTCTYRFWGLLDSCLAAIDIASIMLQKSYCPLC